MKLEMTTLWLEAVHTVQKRVEKAQRELAKAERYLKRIKRLGY